MNTWVLFRDLSELVDDPGEESIDIFAKTLKEHYVGAVDIQVLNPEGEIIMHQPENKLHGNRQKYLTLLADAAKGEVKIASEKREELMETFSVDPETAIRIIRLLRLIQYRRREPLSSIYKVLVRRSCSFDLFDGDAELPIEGFPDDALVSVWDIPPGDKGKSVTNSHADSGSS